MTRPVWSGKLCSGQSRLQYGREQVASVVQYELVLRIANQTKEQIEGHLRQKTRTYGGSIEGEDEHHTGADRHGCV